MCSCTSLTVKRKDKAYVVHFPVLFKIKCGTKTYKKRFPNHLLLRTMIKFREK